MHRVLDLYNFTRTAYRCAGSGLVYYSCPHPVPCAGADDPTTTRKRTTCRKIYNNYIGLAIS